MVREVDPGPQSLVGGRSAERPPGIGDQLVALERAERQIAAGDGGADEAGLHGELGVGRRFQ
jgi:hypothetical protein